MGSLEIPLISLHEANFLALNYVKLQDIAKHFSVLFINLIVF